MTPPSPALLAGSLVTFTVKVGGKAIDSTLQVVSVDTWSAVNKVPKARLVIFDGSPATRDFEASNLKTFLPGNEIEIAAGYEQKEASIFRGVICKQGIEIEQTQGSKLVVEATDQSIKMTLERKNAVFEKVTDGDLIGQLIAAGGLAKDVAATRTVHEEIVQYYASDWDLMLTRAEMNGLVVTAEGGKVTVKEPDTRQAPVLRVEYGESILDLRAEMDAATQYAPSAVKSYSWDSATQKLVEAGPAAVNVKEQGNVPSGQLAQVFKVKKFTQQTAAGIEKTSAQEWSSAELLKSKLSKIRGFVSFQGAALAKTGKTIELAGLGQRFNGTAFVSGVHHRIANGRWTTDADFGLSPRWFAAEAPQLAAPDASGQLPPVKGLQTGVVKQVAKDPGGEFRVLVTLPLLQAAGKGVWARLATFYASGKVGAVFYPEPGDEVVVGFMNEDPRSPVIIGSVFSKKLAPPYPPDEKNTKKALVTRAKLEIGFDEQNKVIEIKTPGKYSITLDEKKGEISIVDARKNRVSLSKSGVSIDSASDLKVTAKGDVTIQAGKNLNLSATANASVKGKQIAHTAAAKFSAKGNAAAEVTASGPLTLRGAVVKIN